MSSVGLDVGGTYLKAAWLDEGDLQVTRRPIPDFIDTSGNAREIDAVALVDSIHDLLDSVIGSRPCERILMTGQMAGLAFVDEQGHALAPLISWQDTRIDAVNRVRGQLSEDELTQLGDGLRVGLPLVTLSELDMPGHGRVTSLIGFVAGALTGTFASRMHATDAASLGLLDVPRCRWSPAALAVARVEESRLPQPVPTLTSIGTSTRFGAQVVSPIGDQQAALMGAELAPGEVSMNIATGCQVSTLTDVADSPAQLRPYFFEQYLRTITHLPAGRLLTAAVREDLGYLPSDEEWAAALQRADDSTTAVGRAVWNIADACIDAARRLGSGASIVFSGGVAQKVDTLRDRIADQLSVPYRVYAGDDAALEGLRRLDRDYSSKLERT